MTDEAESDAERTRLQWEIFTSLGIIAQLTEARGRQTLPPDLPRPLFTILNHMTRMGGNRTVTDLARALQTPQPGMTKSVQKLLDRGYLRAEGDAEDGRRKRLFLTEEGQAARARALMALGSDIDRTFADWTVDDLHGLAPGLYRLRRWLDENRDTTGGR